MGSGLLDPLADHRSTANAFYAEAMLLSDGETEADDAKQAAALFRQVVALDPAFTDAQIKLANLLLQSGQLDQALTQLHAAATLHPDSIPLEVALGYAQRLRGKNEEALRLCAKALTADPDQAVAMRIMLEIAGDQNDLAGGVLRIEDILKAGGSKITATPWLNLARLYLEIARSEVAPPTSDVVLKTRLPILEQAAAKPPPNAETLALLAETYRNLGRKAEAVKTLRKALALEPSNVDIILHCAELEFDFHQESNAIKDYEKAYALNPDFPGLRETLGNLYLDHHRSEDAARVFEEALLDSPQSPSLEIDLGIAYEETHQPEKAQEHFQHVFDAVACPPDAYIKLAFYQLEHKEVKQAGQTLASAQAHFPKSAQICYYQAIQHRYEKDYRAALDSLAQVRALSSESGASGPEASYYLESALTLNLAGQKGQLEATLQEGLNRYPDNPELMNELAYFWADQGHHLPEALALSRRAAALDPDNGPILDTWGWVYFQMGQVKDALPYLQRAAFMTNNDPVVLQHVGDAYLKLGLRREAIATWTRALEKDPRNGDLANRIDAAQAQAKNAHSRSAPTP
jgi:tetratricopeptide (TPR) repeat protein